MARAEAGDASGQRALLTATYVIVNSVKRGFALTSWAEALAAGVDMRRAKVALARRLGALPCLLADGAELRFAESAPG